MAREAQRRTLKQGRAATTRAEILDGAIRYFGSRGISNTTVVELARSIGMTPGALYWHYPTKEDLLLAATEELHARMLQTFAELVLDLRSRPAREQLEVFFARVNAHLEHHPEYGAFFAMVSAESASTNETVASAVRDAIRVYVELVRGMIRHGQTKTGEFRTDIDAEALAHTLIGAHSGVLLHHQLFPGGSLYQAMGTTLDRLILEAMTHKP